MRVTLVDLRETDVIAEVHFYISYHPLKFEVYIDGCCTL